MLEHVDLVFEISLARDGALFCLHRYRCTCVPAPGDIVYVGRVGYRVVSRAWEPQELSTLVIVGVERLA
jgi:hypothetical protein